MLPAAAGRIARAAGLDVGAGGRNGAVELRPVGRRSDLAEPRRLAMPTNSLAKLTQNW
jgi:hypothetical protein